MKYKILLQGVTPEGDEYTDIRFADDVFAAADIALRDVGSSSASAAHKAEIYVLSRLFVDGDHVELYELIKTYIKK